MKIKDIAIKNFRGIGSAGVRFACADLNLLIGDNGTSKTTILEAINFCLSSGYSASRLSLGDFNNGEDNPIEITIYFENDFNVEVPDLYGNSQKIACNGVRLSAKKRDRSAPGKAFNDLVVTEHYFLPIEVRGQDGWVIPRKNGSSLKINERTLSVGNAAAETPRVFYFGKNREKQLQKGFNSSFTNIIDDLNWRFEKVQRTKEASEKFKVKRNEIESHIFSNTDGDTLKKTLEATNKILDELQIENIDLSLMKTLTPYDGGELVKRLDEFELPVSKTGSGIEMITSLVFLETLAKISRENIVIVIDEPELHLHPALQDKLSKHFCSIASNFQIFVSTHSPFLFKSCFDTGNVSVLISELSNGNISISDAKQKGFGLLKWSPSWGEICFFAYGLPTAEFHDDLYSALQDREGKEKISEIEDWFVGTKGLVKEITWSEKGSQRQETLMTYLRNRIHHGDNQNRPMYTQDQLDDSIKRMVDLLKNP
jgi:predicted ATP-dependent endonuclease of OLD family